MSLRKNVNITRLHPNLKLTRTLTGRLATSGFPVLGIPRHSEEGRRIRGLVRAPKGFVIVEIDYSMAELRAAAHLSGDARMIKALKDGVDLHTLTAHLVLNAPKDRKDQDESTHRLPAKAANFGYWMGMEAKGLTESVHKAGNLAWSANCPGCKSWKSPHVKCDSERFFDTFNKQFPGAPAYQASRMSHAEKTGNGYGMWGEQWFLPGVWSPHDEVAAASKRQAFALPIQSGAQRLIKQAMAAVWTTDLPRARSSGCLVESILQVHDSLLFLVEQGAARSFYESVKHTMEHIAKWKVPIVADGKFGPSWLEQESFK